MRKIALVLALALIPLVVQAQNGRFYDPLPWIHSLNNRENAPYNPLNKPSYFRNSLKDPNNAPGRGIEVTIPEVKIPLVDVVLAATEGYAVERELHVNIFNLEGTALIAYCNRNRNYSLAGSQNLSLNQNLARVPRGTEVDFPFEYFACFDLKANKITPKFKIN